MSSPLKIIIVTALLCEALPLIKFYGLKKTSSFPFLIYTSEDIQCIISGIGKINAACAVGFIGKSASPIAWLNIGIAGHRNLSIGEASIVHKIVDQSSGKTIFPTMHPKFPQKRNTLFTVESPENLYRENGLYDMEAYGFAQAAQKFSCAELVQSYKIISDNADNIKKRICEDWVTELIESKSSDIENIITTLYHMVHTIAPLPQVAELYQQIEKYAHFTETQKHQLNNLLIRWTTLRKIPEIPKSKNAKEIILFLKNTLEKTNNAF